MDENLRRAFPDESDARRAAIARESYRHLGREALAILAMRSLTPAEIRDIAPITGWDRLERAIADGRGVIMAIGHFGNWELSGAALAARGVPVAAVVQKQSNALVDREINAVRERLGVVPIERREAPRKVLRALQRGTSIGFVADQDARRAGVFVPFFGTPASTHRGAALFAIRAEAPLFFGATLRRDDGAYECIAEEIVVDRSGPLDDAVDRMTAAFTARLEQEIRKAPEQYFWMHKRWKTKPRKG